MMGSELDPIIATFNAIKFVVMADWNDLQPYMARILHIVIIVLAVMWTFKKIKKI
jgi:hypothetical protein